MEGLGVLVEKYLHILIPKGPTKLSSTLKEIDSIGEFSNGSPFSIFFK
jgi:hypothetical protein